MRRTRSAVRSRCRSAAPPARPAPGSRRRRSRCRRRRHRAARTGAAADPGCRAAPAPARRCPTLRWGCCQLRVVTEAEATRGSYCHRHECGAAMQRGETAYRESLRTPWWWYVVGIAVACLLAAEFHIGGLGRHRLGALRRAAAARRRDRVVAGPRPGRGVGRRTAGARRAPSAAIRQRRRSRSTNAPCAGWSAAKAIPRRSCRSGRGSGRACRCGSTTPRTRRRTGW